LSYASKLNVLLFYGMKIECQYFFSGRAWKKPCDGQIAGVARYHHIYDIILLTGARGRCFNAFWLSGHIKRMLVEEL